MYLFTFTAVQHDFHIRWHLCHSTLTQPVPMVEQELFTLPEHTSSPQGLMGSVLLISCFLCLVTMIIGYILSVSIFILCLPFYVDLWFASSFPGIFCFFILLYYISLCWLHLAMSEIKVSALVRIGTDCICRCHSNYYIWSTLSSPYIRTRPSFSVNVNRSVIWWLSCLLIDDIGSRIYIYF